MNIFEQRKAAKDAVTERACVFVRLAALAISELTKGTDSDLLPDFINSYHGFFAKAYEYETSRTEVNPHHVPGLTKEEYSLSENRAVDAGFMYITVIDRFCNIEVEEVQDAWDECAGEPETWKLNNIPEDLFINGTEKDVVEFFRERFRKEAEREVENAFVTKWSNLYHYYTPAELIAAAKAMEQVAGTETAGKAFTDFLNLMRD